nr:PREDICTED: zinc finger protein 525-like [Latimeria chalumnae]|eukprot:XP_014343243.1 PREDICTED: zinc finger protein 525-like [Latimeria chalumnae]
MEKHLWKENKDKPIIKTDEVWETASVQNWEETEMISGKVPKAEMDSICNQKEVREITRCSVQLKMENMFKDIQMYKQKKRHVCTVCGKSFGQSSHLYRHHQIHRGEKPYQCTECGKRFRTRSNANRHIEQVHQGEKLFKCTKCEDSFTRLSSLNAHYRKHKEEKPYTSTEGDKRYRFIEHGDRFLHSSNLNQNQQINQEEKSYICSDCGKSFSQLSTLNAHCQIHTGNKPYTENYEIQTFVVP